MAATVPPAPEAKTETPSTQAMQSEQADATDHLSHGGAESRPLTEADSRRLIQDSREQGGLDRDQWALNPEQIIWLEDLTREALTAGAQAATMSAALYARRRGGRWSHVFTGAAVGGVAVPVFLVVRVLNLSSEPCGLLGVTIPAVGGPSRRQGHRRPQSPMLSLTNWTNAYPRSVRRVFTTPAGQR